MTRCSAVVLSRQPVSRTVLGAVTVPLVTSFDTAAGLLAARLHSLSLVQTEFFFWLDDDDDVPDDFADVLDECASRAAPLAYTDELVRDLATGNEQVRKSAPYSRRLHVNDECLVHHLVVCRTDAALRAAATLPRGHYMAESLLFSEVARWGAEYVPRVGYVWNRGDGLHRHPTMILGLVQSATWIERTST